MVVDEAVYAGGLGQFRLVLAGFRDTQIVESKVRRRVRLLMTAKQWSSAGNIRPLGEAGSPPFIILWYWVILREVECQ